MRSVIMFLVFIMICPLVSITVLIVTAILEKAPKFLATGCYTSVRSAHQAAPNPAGNLAPNPAARAALNPAVRAALNPAVRAV